MSAPEQISCLSGDSPTGINAELRNLSTRASEKCEHLSTRLINSNGRRAEQLARRSRIAPRSVPVCTRLIYFAAASVHTARRAQCEAPLTRPKPTLDPHPTTAHDDAGTRSRRGGAGARRACRGAVCTNDDEPAHCVSHRCRPFCHSQNASHHRGSFFLCLPGLGPNRCGLRALCNKLHLQRVHGSVHVPADRCVHTRFPRSTLTRPARKHAIISRVFGLHFSPDALRRLAP